MKIVSVHVRLITHCTPLDHGDLLKSMAFHGHLTNMEICSLAKMFEIAIKYEGKVTKQEWTHQQS